MVIWNIHPDCLIIMAIFFLLKKCNAFTQFDTIILEVIDNKLKNI